MREKNGFSQINKIKFNNQNQKKMKKISMIIKLMMFVLVIFGFKANTPSNNFPSSVDSSAGSWIDGNWEGTKFQTNADKGWKTILVANSKTKKFTIQYPELACGGTLELISIDKNRAVFTEKIKEKEICVDNGYIIITLVDKKYISFTCLRDEKTRLASYATLTKQ